MFDSSDINLSIKCCKVMLGTFANIGISGSSVGVMWGRSCGCTESRYTAVRCVRGVGFGLGEATAAAAVVCCFEAAAVFGVCCCEAAAAVGVVCCFVVWFAVF